MAGTRVGVIRLGQAVGKIKYTLLDEQDVCMIQQYKFKAHVDVDRDGNGARVYTYIYDILKGKSSMQPLHNFLWEKYRGGIAPGFKVVHSNGVTVDNRLDNLQLVPENLSDYHCEKLPAKSKEQSLYWIAVQQIHRTTGSYIGMTCTEIYQQKCCKTSDDEYLEDDHIYFECHYPPCTNMERHTKQFRMCGRCQLVRYCGRFCQQEDWPLHKIYCVDMQCLDQLEDSPDR